MVPFPPPKEGPDSQLGRPRFAPFPAWPIPLPPPFGLPLTDDDICELIYDAFEVDPAIPWHTDIDVQSERGIVTLIGKVPSRQIKRAAGDIAWRTPGVEDVFNTLRVEGL